MPEQINHKVNSKLKIEAIVQYIGTGLITDTTWGKLRKEGVYFDIINGDFRQVISQEPYEERIVREIEIIGFTFKESHYIAESESQS